MNISLKGMMDGIRMSGGLKSTQQKMERKEKCESQVSFLEKQKENLKTLQCDSLEEIARKLEMYHSYEDQISAAKKEFNFSQMMHALDEAREKGEKIAEEAEKTAPKTPEERRKDMQEEALGKEEGNGVLTEVLEETLEQSVEETEESLEEILEESVEETEETLAETVEETEQVQTAADGGRTVTESVADVADAVGNGKETLTDLVNESVEQRRQMQKIVSDPWSYKHFDQLA